MMVRIYTRQDLERIAILAKLSLVVMNFLVTLMMPIVAVLAQKIRQGSRLIAAEDANYKDYPFYGLVVLKSEVNSGALLNFFCGTSLISDYFFLTAAHCMDEYQQPTVYGILMGVHNKCEDQGYEIMLDVDSVFLPPGYTFTNVLITDIALIKTTVEVVGYDKLLLPTNPISAGQVGTVIGFGSTVDPEQPEGPQYSCTLKRTPQKILPYDQCFLVTGKTFCARGTESDGSSICSGDSGSPWITQKVDPNGATYEITGIVSAYAPGCMAKTYPNILTDVHEHLEWINGIIA